MITYDKLLNDSTKSSWALVVIEPPGGAEMWREDGLPDYSEAMCSILRFDGEATVPIAMAAPGPDPIGAVVSEVMELVRAGKVEAPRLLAVASEGIAQTVGLMPVLRGVSVEICAELAMLAEHLAASMSDHLEDAPPDWRMLVPTPGERGVTEEAVKQFYAAADHFWRVKPWEQFESDFPVVATRTDGKGELCVSVMGALGGDFGMQVFDSFKQFKAWLNLAEKAEEIGHAKAMAKASMMSVTFDDKGLVDKPGAAILRKHGRLWAKKRKWPMTMCLEKGEMVAPDARHVRLLTMGCSLVAHFTDLIDRPEYRSWPTEEAPLTVTIADGPAAGVWVMSEREV